MAGNGLDSGDALRLSDKLRFFRGWNTDQSPGERNVPFTDLVTLINDPAVLDNVGGGGGGANLSTSQTATTVTVASDSGTDAVLPQVIASGNAGVISGADKAKLDGIAAGATNNTGALADLNNVTASLVDSEASTDGQVLTSDGAGNSAWETPAAGGSPTINEETLSADKTIADGDPVYQVLDPNGVSRDVTLPTTPSTSTVFRITNANLATVAGGGVSLTVKVGTTNLLVLYAGSAATFIYSSNDWWADGNGASVRKVGASVESGTKINYGPNSYTTGAGAFGVSIGVGCAVTGPNSIGMGNAVNVGGASAIAIGNVATASLTGVSIGQSNSLGGSHQVSLGHNIAGTTRWGAAQVGVFPLLSLTANKFEHVGWSGSTTTATITELLMNGNRFTMAAESVVGFKMQVVAREDATNDCKYWELSGAVKRDAANNTSLVGSVTKTVIGADAGASAWDVTVDADDTNESLRVQATGEASHTISWAVVAQILDRR